VLRPRLICLVCLLAFGLPASADTVFLKGGKKFRGKVVSDAPVVVVNIFNSSVPGMTLGVRKFDAAKVKKIKRTLPAPHHEFQRRVKRVEDAGGCIELADWCLKRKLKEERRYALELALRFDPDHAAARKALGSKAPKGNRTAQMKLARRFLDAANEADRAAALAEIRKDRNFPFEELYLTRTLRSTRQGRGYQPKRPIALRADKLLANASYALFVPEKYDPLRPTPLVFGLHGGGAGGADGKLVVGSGEQAMPFYQGHCSRLGWICVCPTALRAGWGNKTNHELVDAVLEEVFALYNIDLNRVYLTGHSMGGGGSWAQGARIPETWACVAPTASFGVHGIDKFKKTRTGLYVYHSDDDPRTRIGGVRPRMLGLPGSGMDFVYTELPGRGHSLPGEVLRDIFGFFEMRTLARGPGRFKPTVRPRSSFRAKLSRDEKKYLPRLDVGGSAKADDKLGRLVAKLKTGGGVAEQVVPELVKHSDPKVNLRVAKVMLKAHTPDVRRFCARVLGGRKAKDQIKTLGRVLLLENDATALTEILDAIEAIEEPLAGDALVKFLKKRRSYLDGRARGEQVDHSDWSTILPPIAKACSLLGSYRPKGASEAIARQVLEGVLGKIVVIYDSQNQRPLPFGQALAGAACSALQLLQDPVALPALERLAKSVPGQVLVTRKYGPVAVMSEWGKDPRISGHVREALRALQARGGD